MKMPTFIESDFITRQIGKKDFKFHKLSIGMLFELRKFATCLSQAIVVFIDSYTSRNDTETIERTVQSGVSQEVTNEKGEKQLVPLLDKEIKMGAIDPKLAEIRCGQKRRAVEDVIDAFASPENKIALGKIIRDSLRDDYDSTVSASDVIDKLPAEAFPEILMGIAEANKGVLGPLVNSFQGLMSTTLEKYVKKADMPKSSDTTGNEAKVEPISQNDPPTNQN